MSLEDGEDGGGSAPEGIGHLGEKIEGEPLTNAEPEEEMSAFEVGKEAVESSDDGVR